MSREVTGGLREGRLGARASCLLGIGLCGMVACGSPDAAPAEAAFAAEPNPARFEQQSPLPPDPAGPSVDVQESRNTAIVRAAERVAPAVVTVSVIRTQRVQPRSVFESFMAPGLRQTAGFGSGFIVDPGGIVLTNEHVIRGASRILVTLSDGTDYEAELVGADDLVDVAVLRIGGTGFPVAPLGTSEGLIIGEWVIAIGNPFGTALSNAEPSVTAGVVSAIDRHIVPSSAEDGLYVGMIQTDASINPGNSGGPLVNALGQVIGVNASIFSRSGGSEGLGFAIPIDRALKVADDLITHGDVRRAWLGVEVEPVQADAWGRTYGVRVSRVAEGSPASEAGVREGARLTRVNGKRLTTPLDFEAVLLGLRADDPLTLEVEGAGRPIELTATSLPSVRAERVTALADLDFITVTPELQAERGLLRDWGAMIVSITPQRQRELGFREGDVIVQVNRTIISGAGELAEYFQSLRGQGQIRITFERNRAYMSRYFNWGG